MNLEYTGHRYRILDTLGVGGTSAVYRARDLLGAREVALKVLAPDGAGGAEAARLLGRAEFRLLASHSHPNLVHVFDYGTTARGLAYFTMELLTGPDLLSFARAAGAGAEERARSPSLHEVIRQVLEALDAIHARDILHLDLKPSNIVVAAAEGGRPRAVLLDFGLARARGAGAGGDRLGGTVEYLAPERLRGEEPSAASDLYSLGVLLHELFTGECPFRGGAAAVVEGHLHRPPPHPEKLPAAWRSAILRLLEKDPARRPRSARDAAAGILGEAAVASAALPPFGAALVGRDEVMNRLEEAVRRAAAGEASSVLLRGGTGTGKSRILRELEVRLQLAGVSAGIDAGRTIDAAGVESRGGETLRPGGLLARILRRAALEAGAAGEAAAAGGRKPARNAAQELAAELDARGAGAAVPPADAAAELEAHRERLFSRFVRTLVELAAERPLVLIIDDLQSADSLSFDGLLTLLRALEHREGTRLALLLACRDSGEDGARAAAEIEAAARGYRSFESVRLAGLGVEAIARYLAQVLGAEVLPEELPSRLAAATGGNVFFIEEYLKLLVASGHLRRRARRWELEARAEALPPIPATVEQALEASLSRVAGLDRAVLEWAAILGRPATAEEIARFSLPPGAGRDDVERSLGSLVAGGFLSRQGERYATASAALREVVEAGMEEPERRRRHGLAAESLLGTGPGEPGVGAGDPAAVWGENSEALEELARHLYLSPRPERARDVLIRAGARARQGGAFREAERHFGRALELTSAARERFDLLLRREDVLAHLGRREARERDLRELSELASSLADRRAERDVAVRRALHLESLGRKREALNELERAGALAAGDPAAEARLLVHAGMLHLLLAEFEPGFAALEEAMRRARSLGDAGLEAECRQLVGIGHYRRGDYDRAVEELGRAHALRREGGAEHRLGALESNLGLVHFDRGDLEAAEERFQASLKTFRRLGLRRGEAVNLLNLGLVYLEMGRVERALDAVAEALQIRRELGDRRAEGADMGNLGAAWIGAGRHERAAPLLEEALSRARELENRQSESANECRLGQLELERGAAAKALARCERALALARDGGLPSQEAQARLGLARARLALAEAAEGGAARAAALGPAREEAEAALRLARDGKMRTAEIAARALLAAAALAAGDLAAAEEHSRAAVEELERRRGWLAEAHAAWFARYRVLEGRRRAFIDGTAAAGAPPPPAEAECEAALRRAYAHLREKADAFGDEELRRSYLENVALHREIGRLHEALQGRMRSEASRRERSFHEIAGTLHSILELDPLLDRLLQLAIETTHAEKGLILLKDPQGDFITRAARGMARESVEDASDICRSVITDVARGGEPVLAADAGSDARFRDRRSIISFQIRTLMCVPMAARGETIGAVYVDGRGAASFRRDDLEYLLSFAQIAAVAVENARLLERLRAENLDLRREMEGRHRFENLLAESPAMDRVLRLMEKVARTSAGVLLGGETGTGKEVIARAIHYAGDRRARPFVAVDCGALPENLLESELFGHRRGAFSGAIHDRVGLFEEADGGTLFLDEVSNTSLDLQAKLLRVLQHGEVRRVGENQPRKVDVRVIAASNVDLRAAVAGGSFREDLFYRLNVVAIEVPPLRERREDIPLLARHFLARSCERHGRRLAAITGDGIRLLAAAPWRGNVRELENLIEKAVILAEEDRLEAGFLAGLLPPEARPPAPAGEGQGSAPASAAAAPPPIEPGAPAAAGPGGGGAPLPLLDEFDRAWLEAERSYLERLVAESGGNLAEAVRRSGVRNRNTLISRLKKHGLK